MSVSCSNLNKQYGLWSLNVTLYHSIWAELVTRLREISSLAVSWSFNTTWSWLFRASVPHYSEILSTLSHSSTTFMVMLFGHTI